MGKPAFKAWIPIPVLLPGEKTSTRIEPGKTIYDAVEPASKQPGIVDAAIWIGHAWADEPRNHAVVMVTVDDKTAATTAAEQLAKRFWAARTELGCLHQLCHGRNTCLIIEKFKISIYYK